jgi:hypothetical protein
MKRIQPKTLIVLNRILEKKVFSQKEIFRSCNSIRPISVGMVNKVINDMISKRFVAERSKWEMKYPNEEFARIDEEHSRRPKYYVNDPIGLLHYISLFRSMKELQVFDIGIDASKEMLYNELNDFNVIYCLGSALESRSTYFRSDDVCFYSNEAENILKRIKKAKPGRLHVKCFNVDLLEELNENSIIFECDNSLCRTADVQTVIDMFCDGKSAYTKPLLNKLWGINI